MLIKSKISKKTKVILFVFLAVFLVGLGIGGYFVYKYRIKADVIAASASLLKMKVESVTGTSSEKTITTTGAIYTINQSGIVLSRRIDPKTNTINPRLVAQISFDKNAGPLTIISSSDKEVKLDSDLVSLDINSDSFFFLTAKSPFSYTHKNLIQNASYNKGSNLDRMWTDGYGGSLHAFIGGAPTVLSHDADSTTIQMQTGDEMSHMVFPSKRFDFEKLYGADAKPLIESISSTDTTLLASIGDNLQSYKGTGVGVFNLTDLFYDCGSPKLPKCWKPVLLDSGILGYKIDPAFDSAIKDFIAKAHSSGMKVIPYAYAIGAPEWKYPVGHPKAGQNQDIATTLSWMKSFQQQYNFDGWYLDGGAIAGNLLDDYTFAKQLRADVGDNGIIINHNSVDAWANDNKDDLSSAAAPKYPGLRGIMLDNYADYIYSGETGSIAQTTDINDAYYRFFESGYGMSQAIGMNVGLSSGKTSTDDREISRLLAQNLNGGLFLWTETFQPWTDPWYQKYKPAYDKRKAEYLSGSFNADVNWPVDKATGWFRTPEKIKVSYANSDKTSATISWSTPEESSGIVDVANSSQVWHPPAIHAVQNTPFNIATKTISFQAKPSGDITKVNPIFGTGAANYYVGFASGNRMIFSYGKKDGKQMTYYVNGVIPNEWHKYSYSFDVLGDSVTLSAYKDDVLLGTRTDNQGYSSAYGDIYTVGSLASVPGAYNYNGALDEMKIYDKAKEEGNPIAYYKFDEGSGTMITDSSGNDNIGLNNGATWVPDSTSRREDCVSGSCLSFDGLNSCLNLNQKKEHLVTLSGLAAGENYQFKIRSSNNKPGTDEIIWGYTGDLAETPTKNISLKKGYNTIDSSQALNVQDFTNKGSTVFSFSQTGSKDWDVSDSSGLSFSKITPGYGYYIYSPVDQTVSVSTGPSDLVDSNFTAIRRGWNLLSNSSDQTKKLADLSFNVIRPGQDNSCSVTQALCFESKQLSELFDQNKGGRAYPEYVLIIDGGATDASKAFAYVDVKNDNLDTLTIAPHTVFWLYLKY